MAAICIFLGAMEIFLPGMFVALFLLPLLLQARDSTSRVSCIHRGQVDIYSRDNLIQSDI